MSIDSIQAFHRRCKELTVLRKGSPLKRLFAGSAAHFSGLRLLLRYSLCPPPLPDPLPQDAPFVVSLTSFPPRIKHLWMVIDTLMRQTCRPAAINLVLCESEFPDRKLPSKLQRYTACGLRIMWVEENLKPHKKYYYSFLEELAGKKRCVITVDDDIFYPSDSNIEKAVIGADLVIGSVLIPGGSTPKLFKKKYLPEMKNGAVFVDVAIDQGGSAETSRPTTHAEPTYIEEGVVHYCVTNMPGAVARTSTISLANATLPFGLEIADHGLEAALAKDAGLLNGLNCYDGNVTFKGVADALDLPYKPYTP